MQWGCRKPHFRVGVIKTYHKMKNEFEKIDSKKFKQLSAREIENVKAGGIFPKRGKSDLGWGDLDGETAHYSVDWRTGWGSSVKQYGDAYVDGTD